MNKNETIRQLKKNETIRQLKKIAFPSVIFVIVGLAAIFLIEVNMVVALIVEFVNFLLYILLLCVSLREYKFKYLILGRKYKKQLAKVLKNRPDEDRTSVVKMCKDMYRRVRNLLYLEFGTPFEEMWKRFYSHLTRGDNDSLFTLCLIFDNINSGGGLYCVFERVAKFYTYSEFRVIVEESCFYSAKIKNILLDKHYEKPYNVMVKCESENNYKLSDIDNSILTNFERNESNKLDAYIEEINSIFYNQAVSLYVEKYKLTSMPDSYEKLYFSHDKRSRFFIINKDNTYVVSKEIFVFVDEYGDKCNNKEECHKIGYWVGEHSSVSYYDSIEGALKNNEIELDGFIEYDRESN